MLCRCIMLLHRLSVEYVIFQFYVMFIIVECKINKKIKFLQLQNIFSFIFSSKLEGIMLPIKDNRRLACL